MDSHQHRNTQFVARLKQKLGISLGLFHLYDARPLSALRTCVLPIAERAKLTFSIVTPSYNQGRYIGETINSVLSQSYPLVEYVIQDSISTDETSEVIASFHDPRLKTYYEKDTGQANAINRGFLRTSGDIMAYLNSDDLLLPHALGQIAAYFEANLDVDALYADRVIINEQSAVVGHWRLPGHSSAVLRLVDYVPQETLFWRRSLWERVGGRMDDTLQFAMDWDLILKFQAVGARIAHISVFTGAFRVHASQKTQAAIAAGKREMRRVRKRYTSGMIRYLLFPLHIFYLWRHAMLGARPLE
ncbi:MULTISPECIES: glycosyltransferase family 2 protein [unclassified Rhizobium]|uniref:glycosyltransferase family 2 protein n=1 Tax=unclassified Rhizobium TaxID=2613769 RepID=UPI000EA9B4A7|nr:MULTISPECIES: glycosyltransferase family 2 protein [unclassified Rhizobium]AYG67909.1 glycosyltransferase [Rhizobium sp. CCGE531]AYG74299.1 glycosyltransferase [Rhizobium sp. CCGE532]